MKYRNSVDNIEHNAILMIAYSSGLKVSELVKLKVEDIDNKWMLICIKESKERKDRFTLLPKTVLVTVKESLRNVGFKSCCLKVQEKVNTYQ
jgi:site-specific recombinase XerD